MNAALLKKFYFVLLPAGFLFFFIKNISAQSIVINEVAWAGSKIETAESKNWARYEWVELYNAGNEAIEIGGWKIENGGTKNEMLIISSGAIPSQGYFLICRQELVGLAKCDLILSKLSLANDYKNNGALILRTSNGSAIDATPPAVDTVWPTGNNSTKQTMERKNPLLAGDAMANWQTSQGPNGTPKQINSSRSVIPSDSEESPPLKDSSATSSPQNDKKIQSPAQAQPSDTPVAEPWGPLTYPKSIFINEIMPSPEGADAENEWLEIFNANDFEVDLSGWQLKDKVGAVRTYIFPVGTKILANNFLVLTRQQTNIALQNTGDGLKIFNPDKEKVSEVDYPKALQGQSYNRQANNWTWSTIPTPGKTNQITQPKTVATSNKKANGASSKETLASANQNPFNDQRTTSTQFLADITKQISSQSRRILGLVIGVAIALGSAVVVLMIKHKAEQ